MSEYLRTSNILSEQKAEIIKLQDQNKRLQDKLSKTKQEIRDLHNILTYLKSTKKFNPEKNTKAYKLKRYFTLYYKLCGRPEYGGIKKVLLRATAKHLVTIQFARMIWRKVEMQVTADNYKKKPLKNSG